MIPGHYNAWVKLDKTNHQFSDSVRSQPPPEFPTNPENCLGPILVVVSQQLQLILIKKEKSFLSKRPHTLWILCQQIHPFAHYKSFPYTLALKTVSQTTELILIIKITSNLLFCKGILKWVSLKLCYKNCHLKTLHEFDCV